MKPDAKGTQLLLVVLILDTVDFEIILEIYLSLGGMVKFSTLEVKMRGSRIAWQDVMTQKL